jgi:hypothetical protein
MRMHKLPTIYPESTRFVCIPSRRQMFSRKFLTVVWLCNFDRTCLDAIHDFQLGRTQPVLLIAIHIHIDVGRSQGGDGGLEMRSVPGLDHDLEHHRLGRQIGEDALMRYLNDVGA